MSRECLHATHYAYGPRDCPYCNPSLSSEQRAKRWSVANAQEKTPLEVLNEAIENCERSLPGSSGMDDSTISLFHTLRHEESLGKMATESPEPSASQTSVHWY